ncbi:anti-sigma factor [Cohnella sp. WQ 127256]|uniref:anti-sigma factor family protein n=1 Tax=Cohnella sp. WQ 127256 TaxID=2938790 RepID=UPI002117378B|nr:zf-HC2 domain-containing protein [Cohnella sp. WQ 127256]
MELMQRYIDSDLDQQETSLMMDHVGQCPDCAAILARLQKLSNELEQLPRVVPKFSLVDAIMPELERLHAAESITDSNTTVEESVSHSKPIIARSHRPSRSLLRNITGVVAAGVVAGLLLFGQPDQWFLSGSQSNNDAAMPSPAAAVAESPLMADESQSLENSLTRKMVVQDQSGSSDSEPKNDSEMGDQKQLNALGGDSSNSVNPEKSPMSISSIPATTSESADGKWRAIAVEGTGTFQVYNTADNSEYYASQPRVGTVSLFEWNSDNTLLYFTLTDAEGVQTQWQLDLATATESQR